MYWRRSDNHLKAAGVANRFSWARKLRAPNATTSASGSEIELSLTASALPLIDRVVQGRPSWTQRHYHEAQRQRVGTTTLRLSTTSIAYGWPVP